MWREYERTTEGRHTPSPNGKWVIKHVLSRQFYTVDAVENYPSECPKGGYLSSTTMQRITSDCKPNVPW